MDASLVSATNNLKKMGIDMTALEGKSTAFDGASAAMLILTFAAGGVAGGFLGAAGEDLWNKFKQVYHRLIRSVHAKRRDVSCTLFVTIHSQQHVFYWAEIQTIEAQGSVNADALLNGLRQCILRQHMLEGGVTTEHQFDWDTGEWMDKS